MKHKKIKEGIGAITGRFIIRIILFVWSVMIVFPFIWVLYTSFKSNKEFYADVWALPEVLRFENYEYAWNTAQFSAYFMNCINFSIVSQLFFFLIKKYIYFFMERHSI